MTTTATAIPTGTLPRRKLHLVDPTAGSPAAKVLLLPTAQLPVIPPTDPEPAEPEADASARLLLPAPPPPPPLTLVSPQETVRRIFAAQGVDLPDTDPEPEPPAQEEEVPPAAVELTVVERPARDRDHLADCAEVTDLIGRLCAEAGEPLSLTITAQLRTAYVHLPTLDAWQAWCTALAAGHKTVTTDQLIGGVMTGVVHSGGWTIHAQLMGSPVDLAEGQL